MQWWVWVPHCGMILCQAGSLVLSLGVISLMLGNPLPPSTPSATTYIYISSSYIFSSDTTFSYIFIFSCYIFSFPTNFLNLLVFFYLCWYFFPWYFPTRLLYKCGQGGVFPRQRMYITCSAFQRQMILVDLMIGWWILHYDDNGWSYVLCCIQCTIVHSVMIIIIRSW